MPPRIAIPMPHSLDHEYAERSIPQYEIAVQQSGGEPVRIALDRPNAEVAAILECCDGILLPGSNADVDPARFNASRSPHTAPADPRRDFVDELLLKNAYQLRKPILGICYGLQSINVYRSGSLIQHIPDFLPEDLRSRVDHEAGKQVPIAHSVDIEEGTRLAEIVKANGGDRRDHKMEHHKMERGSGKTAGQKSFGEDGDLVIPVNSSHHQSAGEIGSGLRISARCAEDGIIEAVEGTDADHFVLAVQWHPERSVDADEPSRKIFRALIHAAETRAR